MSIEARYYDLTHGVHGFITLYVLIALFSLAGLKRGRATFDQFLYWPFTTLPTMVVLGISISVLLWALLTFFGVKFGGIGENAFGAVICMIGGFTGGLYWAARGRPLTSAQGRGAVVFDGAGAQLETLNLRAKAKGKPATP